MKIEAIGTTTSKSLLKHTGKDWDQWIAALDKLGGRNLERKDIVKLLKTRFKQTPWWQQVVTGGYEVHIGRRIAGRNARGEYSITTTKTLNISAKELWKILASEEGQSLWLKPLSKFVLKPGEHFETESGYFGEVRTMKAPLRVRMKWQDPEWQKSTIVQIYCAQNRKHKDKCILVFMHEKLIDGRLRHTIKEHWQNAVDGIQNLVNSKISD